MDNNCSGLFRRFCLNMWTIPTQFDDCVSYEQQVKCLYDMLLKIKAMAENNAQGIDGLDEAIRNLKIYIDNYFENLDIAKEVEAKLDIMAQDGTLSAILQSFKVDKTHIDLTNKENLLTGLNWDITAGWTKSNNDVFTHDKGKANVLSVTVPNIEPKLYILKFTCTNQYASTTEQALIAEFGGSGKFEQYQEDNTVTKYFSFVPSNGELIFTPSINWSGDVREIGLYKIEETDKVDNTLDIYDENDNLAFSAIITDSELNNISISKTGLQKATLGCHDNIVMGERNNKNTGNGYFNVAIGNKSQEENLNGSRNIGVGYASLNKINNGDRNIGIGTFALQKVTDGHNNIGIGADSAWNTTTGSNNVAISNGALNNNTTGSDNVAIGYFAGGNTTGGQNISIGRLSNNSNQTGNGNIALGFFAHYKGTNDAKNVCLGWQTMSEAPRTAKAENNVAIGNGALKRSCGNDNIAIGNGVLANSANETSFNIGLGYDVMSWDKFAPSANGDNIVIGHSSGRQIAGDNNIVFGRGSLNNACSSHNIAIGNSVLENAVGLANIGLGQKSGSNITSGQKNIALGYFAGTAISTASECIVIGQNKGVNQDGYISIGSDGKGLIEFDGTHLYIKKRTGEKVQLAEVA